MEKALSREREANGWQRQESKVAGDIFENVEGGIERGSEWI